MDKRFKWWTLTVFWCLMIFYFTASPNYTYEGTNNFITQFIADEHLASLLNLIIRKLAHATSFGLLAFLVYKSRKCQRLPYFFAWIFSTFYGATDEFHQAFVPLRGPSIYDIMLDSAGALTVLLLIYLFNRLRKKNS